MNDLCYSYNGEDFEDDSEYSIDEALQNCSGFDEALTATIYVGESVRPHITGIDIALDIYERISEQLYDLVGEHSENFIVSKDKAHQLENFLIPWMDSLDFNCWSVKNVKEVLVTEFMTLDEIKEYYQ